MANVLYDALSSDTMRLFLLFRLKVFENRPNSRILHASEASYIYFLSGRKLIKNAKNGQILGIFEN